ncbi:MAG TPA: flippase-like domain-containing protein, partial [Acidimicrobiales bacterium]|nr:flippase-like domain-containing protein [Acidimicrobiales bacterium]
MRAMVADNAEGARRRWWHRGPFVHKEVRWSVGLVLAFLFVFYLAIPLLASHREDLTALGHIHPTYLILGTVLEIGALAAYTQLTYAVLPKNGPRRLRLFRINMSTLALSHVSPGGTAPGAALGYRLLTQSGVSGSDAAFALGTQGIGSAVVLNVLFWFAMVAFVLIHGFHAPTSHGGQSGTILVVVAAAIGAVLLGAFGGLFYLLTRGQERAATVVRRLSGRIRFLDPDKTAATVQRLAERFAVLLEDRPLLIRAVTWATINWLLDAASLWVFVAAFSHFVSPIDLLVAYGLANILAAIPITPGGLGVVEFVLVSMITGFGPTAGQALSGVLAYRAINFWLPIPFGGMAYASLEFERGNLYRRLHLFFLDRYQRRRGALGVEDESAGGPEDRPEAPLSNEQALAQGSGPDERSTRSEHDVAKGTAPSADGSATSAEGSPGGAASAEGSVRETASADGPPGGAASADGPPGGAASAEGPAGGAPSAEGGKGTVSPRDDASADGAARPGEQVPREGPGEADVGRPALVDHRHRFRRGTGRIKPEPARSDKVGSDKVRSETKGAFGSQTDASTGRGTTSENDVPPTAGALG